jgi:hypothetical protein
MLRCRTVSELRSLIEQVGGLHSRAGLAKRWGVSPSYVSEVTARPDFPSPIVIDGREYWQGHLADDWRNTPRKPGPAPQAKE